MTTCASAIYPLTTRSSPSRPRIRRVPSWSSTASISTRSSSSRRSARSARTTRSASMACCSRSTSSQDAARAPVWQCRCAATSTAATPFAAGPSSWAPTTARGSPRPAKARTADAPGCRRNDASASGRLQGRPRHQHLPAFERGRVARECRPPVASGSLRPALLPLKGIHGIEDIAKADRSLVKTERPPPSAHAAAGRVCYKSAVRPDPPMPRIHDVTVPLAPGMLAYPGDPPFQLEPVRRLGEAPSTCPRMILTTHARDPRGRPGALPGRGRHGGHAAARDPAGQVPGGGGFLERNASSGPRWTRSTCGTTCAC